MGSDGDGGLLGILKRQDEEAKAEEESGRPVIAGVGYFECVNCEKPLTLIWVEGNMLWPAGHPRGEEDPQVLRWALDVIKNKPCPSRNFDPWPLKTSKCVDRESVYDYRQKVRVLACPWCGETIAVDHIATQWREIGKALWTETRIQTPLAPGATVDRRCVDRLSTK